MSSICICGLYLRSKRSFKTIIDVTYAHSVTVDTLKSVKRKQKLDLIEPKNLRAKLATESILMLFSLRTNAFHIIRRGNCVAWGGECYIRLNLMGPKECVFQKEQPSKPYYVLCMHKCVCLYMCLCANIIRLKSDPP